MNNSLLDWYQLHMEKLEDSQLAAPLQTEQMEVGKNAYAKLESFLSSHDFTHIHLVYDKHTFQAAGESLVKRLPSHNQITISKTELSPDANGDVIANETSIAYLLTEVQRPDVLIAIGAGTIHDITRFVSYKMGLPFISIPTAPSVDGFNSKGAPIVLKKRKITFQTQAPIALFADTSVLAEAPRPLIAAGVGDMIGKWTSLADWQFGTMMAQEPYSETAVAMTKEALKLVTSSLDDIKNQTDIGMKALIEALLKSGMAMSLFGLSHPASGGEHHLSHYWEMHYLEKNKKQLLHGAKVGVACGLLADHYHKQANKLLLTDSRLTINQQEKAQAILASIPSGDEIRRTLSSVGGSTTPHELGVPSELVENSIKHAHTVRDRHTFLRYINESR
ncbi:sn-glycerol-1-phosphate dehydrogenase [Paenalkalicoccus suaedae]|uniref:sn-glycerol-1-phosphate dehydrogenase n=1 Tax=Paenalkalicoccus suaedae TaxID=2592382 RepID=A0A859FIT5_9BACI|nr:sn-glycerol-1-phosphate dehydrogenase [Paenalkalicoccus suaedae]QKS72828.1 sn-glycerol-1-phosphate dehydrogenase [Paenalkalicoccus suaedae]